MHTNGQSIFLLIEVGAIAVAALVQMFRSL